MLRINPISVKTAARAHVRCLSNRTTIPSERNWDPHEIYPSGMGEVRINGNTLRDGHQSLNGGLHRIDMLEKAAKLIDKIRPADMVYPGSEEIGGGTTVDFPLRFKGENPFRNMERLSSQMPNTPTSALIRSDSLCGYTINPHDVAHAFIRRYAQCGVDVYRNFDAYNNIKNHATVAEAILENGKHYQAAITFTSHPDPTLYNVKWVSDIVKGFKSLGAHSICIKDMAGIASPALMKAWVSEIKETAPELPVIIHSHYTTGFAPITYMQAIEAGCNGIDLSISSLSGRSGHPCMEVFWKVLTDMGYDLGVSDEHAQAAMKPVADLYRVYHPHYEFCEMKMAGTVDYRVFQKGIPGGQISIFKNELIRNNMGHLFDAVMDQILTVRKQCGGVALVTPTAEHVARQATLNAQDGLDRCTEESRLWPGYSEMLRGVLGRTLEKMDEEVQLRALKEWVQKKLQEMITLDETVQNELKEELSGLVDHMWEMVQPILKKQRLQDLADRIRHLSEIDAVKFADRIAECKAEQSTIESQLTGDTAALETKYTSFLAMTPSDADFHELVSSIGRGFAVNMKRGMLTQAQFLELVRGACFCTICPSDIMPAGMEMRKDEIEKMAWDFDFEIPPRDSVEFEEYAILQSMFSFAQNIAVNYFRFHDTKREHWAENPYPPQQEAEVKARTAPVQPTPTMYPFVTKSDSIGTRAQNFSTTEVQRVLNYELKCLAQSREKLDYYTNTTPETEVREKLYARWRERYATKVRETTADIESILEKVLVNTSPASSGVAINQKESMAKLRAQCGI